LGTFPILQSGDLKAAFYAFASFGSSAVSKKTSSIINDNSQLEPRLCCSVKESQLHVADCSSSYLGGELTEVQQL
jgi:hypothetical protein